MHDLEIRLFGEVGVRSASGQALDLGPAKCQVLLAALALSADSAVPVSRLVEMVWGSAPPRTAEKTLQTYVGRLRSALGADRIVRTGGAYRLAIEPEAVDVNRFLASLGSGDTDAALAEWDGHPLAGLEAEGLTAVVDGLVEQWFGAVEADLARRVDEDAGATIGPLTELTTDHPLREGFWALRMTALYRLGRQGDALASYGIARRHLVEELGVEPGPRLRALEASILAHDEALEHRDAAAGSDNRKPTGTVTFAFCDVEGSTRLWASDRQTMAAAMDRHRRMVSDIAERNDGHLFASVGDTSGIAFHRAGDGVSFASALQDATSSEPWPGNAEIRVRIGLNTGEIEEADGGYFGQTVNVAEQIAQAGNGGQTLISATVAALLDREIVTDLGEFRLTDLAADRRLFQLGSEEHAPLRTERRRGNLPRRQGRLIGRDGDLRAIEDAMTHRPVVTLIGPGGIGKTRLALAAAKIAETTYNGGAWLIELAAITRPGDVERLVAETLSVQERPGETLTQTIVEALGDRHLLLVLDNCEQVIEGSAAIADAIVSGCPRARVLATSRQGLGIEGEQHLVLAALDPADGGAELFNERALAVDADFDTEQHRSTVEEICGRLDGMPLAIELAAARTRSLSPEQVVARLNDQLRLLTNGRRTGEERHRTLRATVQWSYDLLAPGEQHLFRCLSIFAGPFDLAGAESIAVGDGVDPIDIDDLIGSLVDQSMIIVESGPRGRRFRMLEIIRHFAAEQLGGTAVQDRLARRHADWCLANVIEIRGLLSGQAEIRGVERLSELWPNLRAAIQWACRSGNHRLAHDLLDPIAAEVYLRSQTEIGDWAEQLLAVTPPEDEAVMTFGVIWASRRYMRNLDHAAFEALVARFGEPDVPLVHYARAFVEQDFKRMARAAPEALERLRLEGDRYAVDLFELAGHGTTLLLSGQIDEHEIVMTELAARFRRTGPPTGLNWALTMLGYNAALRGKNNEAWRFFEESMSVEVPERTHNMRNPLASRTALRRGDQDQAFSILRGYIDELIENDNLYLARMTACADFIAMMLRVGHVAEAAHILGYLETAGRLSAASFNAVVTKAATTVSAESDPTVDRARAAGEHLDDRNALAYMRDVLERLQADAEV